MHCSLAAQQPGRTRRQQERQRKAVSAALQAAQEEKGPGTSAPELALVPANAEGGSAQQGALLSPFQRISMPTPYMSV